MQHVGVIPTTWPDISGEYLSDGVKLTYLSVHYEQRGRCWKCTQDKWWVSQDDQVIHQIRILLEKMNIYFWLKIIHATKLLRQSLIQL